MRKETCPRCSKYKHLVHWCEKSDGKIELCCSKCGRLQYGGDSLISEGVRCSVFVLVAIMLIIIVSLL